MTQEEANENRREVVKKLCEKIRRDEGRMINAGSFKGRPYYDSSEKYQFGAANFCRLMLSDKKYIDPRWYKIEDIQKNNWKLKEGATSEKLEEWQDDSTKFFLKEFYNASEIEEKTVSEVKKETLEEVLEFLIVRGMLKADENLISLKNGLDAVKRYAGKFYRDELTKNLTAQLWLSEIRLPVKMKNFLPMYSEETLKEVEEEPKKLFAKMKRAGLFLERLRREKVQSVAEEIKPNELFAGLKIIYHGSEKEIRAVNGCTYSEEAILKGEAAYEFLNALKSTVGDFKTWLEFYYKDYNHGKFLLKNTKEKVSETVGQLLKKRLDKNRREILNDMQGFQKFSIAGKILSDEELVKQLKIETEKVESLIEEFECEEKNILSQNQNFKLMTTKK